MTKTKDIRSKYYFKLQSSVCQRQDSKFFWFFDHRRLKNKQNTHSGLLRFTDDPRSSQL